MIETSMPETYARKEDIPPEIFDPDASGWINPASRAMYGNTISTVVAAVAITYFTW